MSCEDSFVSLKKLMSKVSAFHPTRSLFLSFSVALKPERKQLILVLQVELFVFTLLPIHTVLLVSLRTSHY